MEEWFSSEVRQSLVRPVVNGNMPAKWLMIFALGSLFFCAYLCFAVSFWTIPVSVLICWFILFLLKKAFSIDNQFFTIYFRFILRSDYYPAIDRVNYFQKKYN